MKSFIIFILIIIITSVLWVFSFPRGVNRDYYLPKEQKDVGIEIYLENPDQYTDLTSESITNKCIQIINILRGNQSVYNINSNMNNINFLVDVKKQINIPILPSKNPRFDFYRVVMEFFTSDEFKSGIHKTAIIEKNTFIGKNVYIGPHCYIGNDVKIGDNTKILANTCVYGKTEIGSNSVVKSNTTIGSEGFSFSFADNEFLHFPHLGKISIGSNVWIGSNCTIEKSQMDQMVGRRYL